MKPRAFVVMPFGTKTVARDGAQDRRVDFDQVYERLLAPALTAAGCEPFRAGDEEGAAGAFFELVTADVVLADVSVPEADVFYALGVRHGVAPRGVVMVHGGWGGRPFDVAPDRTLSYDGELFAAGGNRGEDWERALAREVERLARPLERSLAADRETVASPVYAALPGLVPVDWRGVETARSECFGGALDDWKRRARAARDEGRAGDLLTLAAGGPTRYHRATLLFAAARVLIEMQRFEVAKQILDEVLAVAPDHLDARCQAALVLDRLGQTERADACLEQLAGEPEAQEGLARIYEDRWRTGWEGAEDPARRRLRAMDGAALATRAAEAYWASAAGDLSAHDTGIRVVALTWLLRELGERTGTACAPPRVDDVELLVPAVRLAARVARDRAREAGDERGQTRACATLGELAVIEGVPRDAERAYGEASRLPGMTWFRIDAMLGRLGLYRGLELGREAVARSMDVLERALARVAPPMPPPDRKVVLCSGHMIDEPDRPDERFPPEKEAGVREALAEHLDGWRIGTGDLAICGGARGADILFAELCRERGATVQLYLALPKGEFLRRSVRLEGTSWERRFLDLAVTCDVFDQHEQLGAPPRGTDVFQRNNVWILDVARTETGSGGLRAVLVWDERPTGDGAGGTSHFAARVRSLDGRIAIVNPVHIDKKEERT